MYGNGLPCNAKLFCKLLFSLRRIYSSPAVLAIRPFWGRPLSTRFIFRTEISIAKFLILSFTCSMSYSVLCMYSTNHCSGFRSIFLQMKREMDGKSNMLFCYCHREHDWVLRLCASNTKPYGILGGQMSTLWNRKRAGRYIKFKLLFRLYEF